MFERVRKSIFWIISILLILEFTAVPGVAHEDQKYTAQRRPRVTVMQFKDTNTSADASEYGESVSAMLVTFLKRKSQFVVVERQDVQSVLVEWQRNQEGQTKQDLSSTALELLERIDVIVQGSVTVLGNRIEVDGKILSREDGRIITAAERSGPIDCLRQVVGRLGVALEHGFLKPYYGRVQLTIYDPENVNFLLTPILTPDALDEEKPPGELESTTFPGEDVDVVRKWIASPATHTIENILAGWYTLRLTREGYENVGIPNSVLRAVETSRGFEVRYHEDRRMLPLSKVPNAERFQQLLIRVDSRTTSEIDLSERKIEMRKKQGALDITAVSESKGSLPLARVMMRSVALEINPEYQQALQEKLQDVEKDRAGDEAVSELPPGDDTVDEDTLEESADENEELRRALHKTIDIIDRTVNQVATREEAAEDVACDFLEKDFPPVFDYGRKVVTAGESFELSDFKGGELYFEDYRGESIPVGMYEIAVWAPRQKIRKQIVMVSEDHGDGKSRQVALERQRRDVLIVGKSRNKVRFVGQETRLEKAYGMDTETGLRVVSLPVDLYEMENDAEGLGAWRRQLDLRRVNEEPPALEEVFAEAPADGKSTHDVISLPVEVRVKSAVWVGGRFQKFRPFPNTFYNPRVSETLDEILEGTLVYDWSSLDADDDLLTTLADQLRDIDLLILDEDDMSRIRVFPELAAVIRRYIENGHALMAFVAREGDYQNVVGKPLTLKKRFFESDRMRLNLEAGHPKFDYNIELGWNRPLLKLKKRKYTASSEWKVVSYTKRQRRPRVVVSGGPAEGGYVMVWFETSKAEAKWQTFTDGASGIGKVLAPLRQLFGGGPGNALDDVAPDLPPEPVPGDIPNAESIGAPPHIDGSGGLKRKRKHRKLEIEEQIRIAEAAGKAREANRQIALARAQMKRQALLWAEYLMYRRLDDGHERAGELQKEIRRLQ